ncbi:MAG: HD domain-containing protein [Acholeplasmataceae bacterium]|nr:HD domain-containing protein [Acholeplasmataceae bacterium]
MIQTMIGDDRIASIVLEHHERFDGTGYPKGVGGANISLEARIIAICDAYDAMNSHRSYAKPMTHESSIHELIVNKGTQFDPNLVDLFIAMIRREGTR